MNRYWLCAALFLGSCLDIEPWQWHTVVEWTDSCEKIACVRDPKHGGDPLPIDYDGGELRLGRCLPCSPGLAECLDAAAPARCLGSGDASDASDGATDSFVLDSSLDDGPGADNPTDTVDCSNLDDSCQVGTWDGSACVAVPRDGSCDDGDPCTVEDKCLDGNCSGEPRCVDADPCSSDECAGGVCSFPPAPSGTACAEGVCAGGVCLDGMVWVPGGMFTMGCTSGRCGAFQEPARTVTVSSFAIDRLETTIGEYLECMEDGPCTIPSGLGPGADLSTQDAELPVRRVGWPQAGEYCDWRGKRLCTEAEWELAAGGPTSSDYPWGDAEPSCQLANFQSSAGLGCGSGGPWSPGSAPDGASPFGAFDMAGNVLEWVQDCFGDYAEAPTDGTAAEDCSGWMRVIRGGSWKSVPSDLLKTWRGGEDPSTFEAPQRDIGVRCCGDG